MKIKEYKREGGIFVRIAPRHYDKSVAFINEMAGKLRAGYPMLTDRDIQLVEGDPLREDRIVVLGAYIDNEKL